jgi:hypothetical protein
LEYGDFINGRGFDEVKIDMASINVGRRTLTMVVENKLQGKVLKH